MYPNLFYVCKDLFGIEIPFLRIVNMSGLFIALSIVVAAWVWKIDLKRKQAAGELIFLEKKVLTGTPVTITELFISFCIGFIVGFKIIGLLFTDGALQSAQKFIFSLQGNWIAGLLLAFVSAGLKWAEKKGNQLPKPEIQTVEEWPSDWMTKGCIAAAISGVVGCKLFNILENWSQFKANPVATILSPTGFTYYGGLILATITMWLYYKKWGKYRMRIADAMAPGLMLGYAVGRTGCQLSGDGDWGIPNPNQNPFNWLPDWLWAYDYPHNALAKGLFIPGCDWDHYCYRLNTPVYPTPLYEIILSVILFALLWGIRKRFRVAGRISALYLIVNGVERFFIEIIRVNPRNTWFGFDFTDSQVIAVIYVIAGVLLYAICPKLTINREAQGINREYIKHSQSQL